MKPHLPLLLSLLIAPVMGLHAAGPLPELKSVLGQPGKLLFNADFDAPGAKPFFAIASGTTKIVDGTLWVSKLADAKHIGVSHLYSLGKDAPAPLTEFIMQADFCFDEGGNNFSFEFTKPGKVEHGVAPEFFVSFSLPLDPKRPASWGINDNAPRTAIGKQTTPLKTGEWCRVLIEVRNDEVAVQLSNGQALRGKCNRGSTPKRSPTISYNGDGVKGIRFDNFKIWTIQ